MDEQQLAMRIYQAETGIKHLYFVFLTKTDKMRYLLKAKQLKSKFMATDTKQKAATNSSQGGLSFFIKRFLMYLLLEIQVVEENLNHLKS